MACMTAPSMVLRDRVGSRSRRSCRRSRASRASAQSAWRCGLQAKAAPLIESGVGEAAQGASCRRRRSPTTSRSITPRATCSSSARTPDRQRRLQRADRPRSFYIQHLGYRKRVGKLTKPDAEVKQEVMERQLHEYLKKTGSLAGRMLTVDKDYDRKFVLAHDAVGNQIDQALNFLQEAEGRSGRCSTSSPRSSTT
jgi:hypothetical protein